MLNLLISSISTLVLYSLFGFLITKNFKSNTQYFSKLLINGAILISFLSLLLNFFLPLSKVLNSLFFIIIFIFFFKPNIFNIKKYFYFLIITTFITYILLYGSHMYRPDAGLYHLPYTKILNEEKIIFGLTNLHFRFGHISILQYLSASNVNFITGNVGITIPSAIIASSIIINFLSKFRQNLINKNYNFHFYFLIGILIYVFLKMNRYAEYGNDAPAHFLTFYLFSEFLKLDKKNINKDEILNISLIALFVVLNKVTLIPILIIPLILIIRKKSFLFLKKFNFYLIVFFGALWLFKSLIISGCLIYPLKVTCFKSLDWSDISTVEKISVENEAFSKNWPNFKNKNIIEQEDYIKNFNWITTWIKKFIDEQKEKSFAFSIILFFLYFIIIKNSKKNKFSYKNDNLFLLTLILSALLWFIKIPDFRYASSIIISLIIYPFASLLTNRFYYTDKKIVFSSIIILFFTAFITKNFIRIFNTTTYFNYPNPRIYSHNDDNKKLNYSSIKIENKIIHNQNKGYCMYTKNLCSPYQKDMKIKKIRNYLIFLKKT